MRCKSLLRTLRNFIRKAKRSPAALSLSDSGTIFSELPTLANHEDQRRIMIRFETMGVGCGISFEGRA